MVNKASAEQQAQGAPDALLELLSPPQRLAIAYAPAHARPFWRGLLALDRRAAQFVDPSREPLLAQMRLAWWREMFGKPAQEWPQGEPLLAELRRWDAERGALVQLIDGWEALIGEAPLPVADIASLAHGRVEALAGLSRLTGGGEVEKSAYRWALADLAGHIGNPAERESAMALLRAAPAAETRMGRGMRPLLVLRILAERAATQDRPIGGAGDLATAVRVGLLGR